KQFQQGSRTELIIIPTALGAKLVGTQHGPIHPLGIFIHLFANGELLSRVRSFPSSRRTAASFTVWHRPSALGHRLWGLSRSELGAWATASWSSSTPTKSFASSTPGCARPFSRRSARTSAWC